MLFPDGEEEDWRVLLLGQSSLRELMERRAECSRTPGLTQDWVGRSEGAGHCCSLAVCHMCKGCACAFIWSVHAYFRAVLKGTIRQYTFSFPSCENGIDATPASRLPLWLASCVPPVNQRSFCLHLSSPCSHSLPIYFHLPHISSFPVFVFASKWFSQAVQSFHRLAATPK